MERKKMNKRQTSRAVHPSRDQPLLQWNPRPPSHRWGDHPEMVSGDRESKPTSQVMAGNK